LDIESRLDKVKICFVPKLRVPRAIPRLGSTPTLIYMSQGRRCLETKPRSREHERVKNREDFTELTTNDY